MIKVTVLVENTSVSPEFRHKHGLCLYIETIAPVTVPARKCLK